MRNVLVDLGRQPLANYLCKSEEESFAAELYTLKAEYNDNLKINLDKEIDPHSLYNNYYYHSGVNKPYIKHCEELYYSTKHLKSNIIIDIGGNDGTLLKTFKRLEEDGNKSNKENQQKRYINVDVSDSFQSINNKLGIEYYKAFFSDELNLPKADIIISTNVFQHTKNIDIFLKGISKFLNGVWILEFPYTLRTLEKIYFDQFYHEHFYYWLITPLEKLFKMYGLKIIYITENTMQGGSIRIWLTNKQPSSPEIIDVINSYKEKESILNLDLFNSRVKKKIQDDIKYIKELNGKTIFFGAAAKGVVYLNALGITSKTMPNSYVIDDTIEKQGLYIPGTGLKIYSRNKLSKDDVDNIIILSHNYYDYIVNSLRNDMSLELSNKCKIMTMFPAIQIH
tara:strand:+ start:3340 stop:4524 length:1185 start_codon:yes stop_codon:yes gene_type:complete